jgi:hypothetical protein
MLQVRLNNLNVALRVLKGNQKSTHSPSEWARIEEDIVHISSMIKETECLIKTNSAET